MTSEGLNDLILSIFLAVKDDVHADIKTTTYKLPKAALTNEVIEALQNKFGHYKSVSVAGNILSLVHPEQEDQ